MTQDLFISSTLTFEKVASEVALPEDPNAWPNEILQELFKQVPNISDFEPHVVMDRVDAERGFAFGHIEVMNKTELQRNMDPQALAAAGIKQARIPIIVRDRKLQPFDTMVTENSRVIPLTEARLRGAVFRPNAFDVTSLTPGDTSMIGQLYPPFRQGGGFGGGMQMGGGGTGKMASASLLAAILPTIEPETYATLHAKLASRDLQVALVANAEHTAGPIGLLSSYEPPDPVKQAAAIYGSIPCNVVQLSKTASGYQATSANSAFWAPMHHVYDRGAAVRSFGEKIVLAADMNGTVTVAEGAPEEAAPVEGAEAGGPELIKEFGVYKVRTEEGDELEGYVFPELIDVDGHPLPMMLFTNGDAACLQGEISGAAAGEASDFQLAESHPSGYGFFWDGQQQATIPIDIHATLDEGDGVALMGETFDGRQVQVMVQPNLAQVTGEGDHMLVPDTMQWISLDQDQAVKLVGDPIAAEKTAHPQRAFAQVTLRAAGNDSFSLSGIPVEKLASEQREFLNFDETVFLLAGFGVAPKDAMHKMALSYGHSTPVEVPVRRMLKTAGEQIGQQEKKADGLRSLVHEFRVDLLKEAAVIPDPVAVDTVLSLGFINPENLSTFIGYLPLIDEAQSRMCELLVASRLGMRDVPTSALEKAVRATEDVLEGLKVLAFQKN
jgi:hypothetical protein